MQTAIWAIGMMLVLMLIIYFLPLGFTLKGKLFIVLASFLLSLGGLAALQLFSLLSTILLLALLCFFTAYIMNKRGASLIYLKSTSFEDILLEEKQSKDLIKKTKEGKVKDEALLPLSELEINKTNLTNPVHDNSNDLTGSILEKTAPILHVESEIMNEEIPFILDREEMHSLELEGNLEFNEDYLSGIESLVDELTENYDKNLHETNEDNKEMRVSVHSHDINDSEELEELSLLFGLEEVAAGIDEIVIDTKKDKKDLK